MSKSVNRSPSTGEKKQTRNSNIKSTSKGKTAKEIVKRHLSNKDDKITDDDLRHLKIDLSVPKDRAHKPLPIKKDKKRPKDSEKDNSTLTPWDVISE
jgi:hypothetical protein